MHVLAKVGLRIRVAVTLAAVGLVSSVAAAPVISSFTPKFGSASDPGFITINGSGFSPGTVVVRFNGVQDVTAGATSGTTIQAHVPGGAPIGAGPIFVSVNGVGVNSAEDFTVIGNGPFINGFSPSIGAAGADVTISGAHFSSPMIVRFGGVATSTNVASSTQFIVKVPAGAVSGPIIVSNSLGSWTSASNFYVPPVIKSFSPTNGRAGTNVLILGTNFLGATAVLFNNSNAAFTILSNNAIQATAPVGVTTGPLRVVAPAGSAYWTANSNFVVQPTVTGFSPIFGPVGTSVTVTGANFNVGTPVVKFGGVTAATPTGVTFSQLTAVVPNGATTGPITVTTADGTGTSPSLFYLPPRITGFTPTNSAPGTTVMITGTNFTDASAVSFNGTPATFTVTNNNVIGAIVPVGFTTGPLSITTPAGTTNTASLASSNFYAAPIITGFTPTHGLPGTNVTIFGSSFLGTSAVRFQAAGGGTTNAAIVSVANGQLVVRVPTNAVTGPITVVAPAGTDTSSGTFILDYAELLVTVTDDPDPVTVSNQITYTILVKNFGPFASQVNLTNTLPVGVNFVSSTHGSTVSGVTAANLGTINVNATVIVTIVGSPTVPGIMVTNRTVVVTGPIATTVETPTFVEPLPILSVAFNAPNVLLSWPTALSNYSLQFKTNLPGTNWQNVLTPPAVVGNSNVVTQTNLGAGMFYRLKR